MVPAAKPRTRAQLCTTSGRPAHSCPAVRAQSLVSPAAGVLGDRCNRMHLIVAGTACWAVFTMLFGFAKHYAEVWPLGTVRCVELLLLRLPACQRRLFKLWCHLQIAHLLTMTACICNSQTLSKRQVASCLLTKRLEAHTQAGVC